MESGSFSAFSGHWLLLISFFLVYQWLPDQAPGLRWNSGRLWLPAPSPVGSSLAPSCSFPSSCLLATLPWFLIGLDLSLLSLGLCWGGPGAASLSPVLGGSSPSPPPGSSSPSSALFPTCQGHTLQSTSWHHTRLSYVETVLSVPTMEWVQF